MNPQRKDPDTESADSRATDEATRRRQRVYVSGDWEIDFARRELRKQGVPVPIGGRAFEIIAAFVDSPGDLVTKDDLMDRVWSGAVVEDNTLQVHISAIRKALGADRGMLRTVSGRGYRLLGSWTVQQHGIPSALESSPSRPATDRPFRTNVPIAASALIGREGAVQQLRDLLSAYRIVTLTGPGGIGKTVLAAEVARRLFPALESDVLFVELVSLSDPGLVPSAAVSVLGLQLGGDEISPESVARAIGSKKILLVLDNCEHVVEEAASLAETIVRLCPRASILTTSREVLRIEGEFVYHVPPLDVPSRQQEERGDVLEHSAVQLFLARTRSLRSDVPPRDEDIPVIASVCRRLDGIPLAIEFAAARAATLGIPQVAGHLDDRFALLTGSRRTALPRHQTLRATLDWSYELLPDPERSLLRRLAIFPAGFTLDAATAVMSDGGAIASAVAEGISNLVAKSLVTIDGAVPGGRWRLLETIRAYALEKLGESGEREPAARRHAEFFRDLLAPHASGAQSPLLSEDMPRCGREIDNVRAALDWSFSPTGDSAIGVALTSAYVPVWLHLGLLFECRERADRALAGHGRNANLSTRLRMQLNMALGLAGIFTMGSVEKTRTVLGTALEAAVSLDDIDAQMWAIWGQWVTHYYAGENRVALSLAEQLAGVVARIDDPFGQLMADRIVANTLQYGGDQREARRLFERVLENCIEPRDRRNTFFLQLDQRVLARAMLARALLLLGYLDRAIGEARASLEEAQATGYKFSMCEALRMAVCTVTILIGDLDAAETAVAALIDTATSANGPFWKLTGRCLEAKLMIKRGEFAAGTAQLRAQLEAAGQTGWAIWYPEFLGVLAEGLAGLERIPEALHTVDQALAKADRDGERIYVAELFRLKGGFLLRDAGDGYAAAAEHCFGRALDVAREQGALFWELRAAVDLARLRVAQARPEDARRILEPVYGGFTEGFETADLMAAKRLLSTLG
jgi:predicted ATPase/DNA-binding winged helix-turn-helix (wHTH) protein